MRLEEIIANLQEKRSTKVAEMETLSQTIATEERAFSDEEKSTFDSIEKEVAELDETIKRHNLSATHVKSQVSKMKPPLAIQDVELSDSEKKEYNFGGAIRSLYEGKTDNSFAMEVSREYAQKNNLDQRAFHVPPSILKSAHGQVEARDIQKGVAAEGGNLVATNLGENYIELLRKRSAFMGRGINVIDDLVGELDLPRENSDVSIEEVLEGVAATESAMTWDKIQYRPRNAAANVEITDMMMRQTDYNLGRIVQRAIARATSSFMDDACTTDLLALSGIGAVIGGTNGAVPTWQNIVNLEDEVANDNADVGNLAYITNSRMRGVFKTTEKSAGTAKYLLDESGQLNGHNLIVSNTIPNDLTKGTSNDCSAIIFANMEDITLALWGGLSILVNPYVKGGERKTVIHSNQMFDFGFDHPESFAVMADAKTS